MGSLLVIPSQRKGLKMQKKIQPFAKTQIIEDITIISCYVNIVFFLFQMFFIRSAKFLLYKKNYLVRIYNFLRSVITRRC